MTSLAGASEGRISATMMSEQASQRAFWGVLTLLFAGCATVTIVWCASMTAMGGMAMPGGWTMSMAWMRMPGQTWLRAAASFVGTWDVMMIAMMLPTLAPMLWRYRLAVVRTGEMRPGLLVASSCAGYFFVWTALGIVAFALGVGLTTIAMQSAFARVVPFAIGVVVLIAGTLQFTAWKARRLACCREVSTARVPADVAGAWRHGLRLGVDCACCCCGLMAILLVVDVMDVRAMAAVTAAVSVERLARRGERTARAIGVVVVAAGSFLIARSVGLA